MQLGLTSSRTFISDLVKTKPNNLTNPIGFSMHNYGNIANSSFPLFHQRVFYMKFFDQEKDKRTAAFLRI